MLLSGNVDVVLDIKQITPSRKMTNGIAMECKNTDGEAVTIHLHANELADCVAKLAVFKRNGLVAGQILGV